MKLSGNIQAIVKPSDWKIWDNLETSGQWNDPESFEIVANIWADLRRWRKFWNYLEMSRKYWNQIESLRSSGIIQFWNRLEDFVFCICICKLYLYWTTPGKAHLLLAWCKFPSIWSRGTNGKSKYTGNTQAVCTNTVLEWTDTEVSKSATTDDPSFISGHQWQQKLVVIQIQTIQ